MTPDLFAQKILIPALGELSPVIDIPYSTEAARFLLAIALQESGLLSRFQLLTKGLSMPGPGRGWWRLEQGGGVLSVFLGAKTKEKAIRLCEYCQVLPRTDAVHRAVEGHDLLSTGFARLLLWTDPTPLPQDAEAGWVQYRNYWAQRNASQSPVSHGSSSERWAAHWETANLYLYP